MLLDGMIPSTVFRKNGNVLMLPDGRPCGQDLPHDVWQMILHPVVWGRAWNMKAKRNLHGLVTEQLSTNCAVDWSEVSRSLGNFSALNCYLQYINGNQLPSARADNDQKEGDETACRQDENEFDSAQILESTVPWTEEENRILNDRAMLFRECDWVSIASVLPGRSPLECLKQYQRVLNKRNFFLPWTLDEENRMIEAIDKGHNDQSIIRMFPGRPIEQILRLLSKFKAKYHRIDGPWTADQERKLILSVLFAVKAGWLEDIDETKAMSDEDSQRIHLSLRNIRRKGIWNRIAQYVPDKDNQQCRIKWHSHIYPLLSGNVEDQTDISGKNI